VTDGESEGGDCGEVIHVRGGEPGVLVQEESEHNEVDETKKVMNI